MSIEEIVKISTTYWELYERIKNSSISQVDFNLRMAVARPIFLRRVIAGLNKEKK